MTHPALIGIESRIDQHSSPADIPGLLAERRSIMNLIDECERRGAILNAIRGMALHDDYVSSPELLGLIGKT